MDFAFHCLHAFALFLQRSVVRSQQQQANDEEEGERATNQFNPLFISGIIFLGEIKRQEDLTQIV
jgi:hypothetical protein